MSKANRSSIDNAGFTFLERLWHSGRVRSLQAAAAALAETVGERIDPSWWQRHAPWYAGRAVEALNLHARTDGARFFVPDGAHSTFLKGLLLLGGYEPAERHAVARYAPLWTPVVELGASIGVVSCIVNRKLRHPEKHLCVEADPRLVACLQRNRNLNSCQFSIVHAAVAYDVDLVQFGISGDHLSGSLSSSTSPATCAVPTITLARLLRDAGYNQCTLICDIEGAEADLVKREADILSQHVTTFIVEVHPHLIGGSRMREFTTELDKAGFYATWRKRNVWVLRNHRLCGRGDR